MNIDRMISGLKTSCDGCNHICDDSVCLAPNWLAAKTFPQLFFLESWYRRHVGEIPPPSEDVQHDIRTCPPRRLVGATQSYLCNIAHAREAGMIDDLTLALMLPPAIHYLRSLSAALYEMPDVSSSRLGKVDPNEEVNLVKMLAS